VSYYSGLGNKHSCKVEGRSKC